MADKFPGFLSPSSSTVVRQAGTPCGKQGTEGWQAGVQRESGIASALY